MQTTIKIFDEIPELAHFFGELMVEQMQDRQPGQPFSLVLSGGSTPKAVFEYLATHFRDRINWQEVQVFWGDERCVPPESSESNYKMAYDSLLSAVPIPALHIFRIQGEAADPDLEAHRYAAQTQEVVPAHNGLPQFDLVMLGLGDDGHTASIFPGSLHLFDSDALFVVAQHPQSGQKRVSATGKLINNARTVVFLATGPAKTSMVATLLQKQAGWEDLPAAYVQPTEGQLYWLLDAKAAAHITQS